MTPDRTDRTGFAPHRCERANGHRSTAVAQLITSAALALSIAIAATVVSIGIARADGLAAVADDPNAHISAMIVLALVGMGGLIALIGRMRAKLGA